MAYILYIGDSNPNSTSSHRANALMRLGHKVEIVDPNIKFSTHLNTKIEAIHYRTGYVMLQPKVNRWVKQLTNSIARPDIIWVNSGEWLGPQSLKILKKFNCPIILYNNDDPTGNRDGMKFHTLLQALPYYDLCAVKREINLHEYKDRGAKKVIKIFMSYDEVAHRPFDNPHDIAESFRSDVAFIGTWMRYEQRDQFLLDLINDGVPVSIWGGRWKKSPLWKKLQFAYKGEALGGRNYVAAMQGAKICLGLLSKGNRDLHTRRSVEVPYAGGLLCAERTSDHLSMFEENKEAVFWSDVNECAVVCKKLLSDQNLRESIRLGGFHKVRSLSLGSEDVCRQIMNEYIK